MAVLNLVENIRLAIEARDIYLVTFMDFSVAFNCLHLSSILSCRLGGGLSRHSALIVADSFSGRVFSVVRSHGTLSDWYPLPRGFGQGSRAGSLYYNASSRRVFPRLFNQDVLVTCLRMTRPRTKIVLSVRFVTRLQRCRAFLIQSTCGATILT